MSAEWLAEKYRVKLATVKYVLTNEKYTGDSIFHKWYTTDTLPFDCRETGESVINTMFPKHIQQLYQGRSFRAYSGSLSERAGRTKAKRRNHIRCGRRFTAESAERFTKERSGEAESAGSAEITIPPPINAPPSRLTNVRYTEHLS